MSIITGRQRYDANLKEWVPVEPPRRSTGRVAIKVEPNVRVGSSALSKDSPYAKWAKGKDAKGRPHFGSLADKREIVKRAADMGERLVLASEVYTDND